MFRHIAPALCLAVFTFPTFAQQNEDKPFDVRSSVGDLHVGKDADAHKAGLPLYPGARPKRDEDSDPFNFGVLTENFGLNLVVAKYESDDSPSKVIAFYRHKLKKYGTVLECHTQDESASVQSNDDRKDSKELKCDGDNTGPNTELKVGSEDDQHIVAVQPRNDGKSSEFAVVYLHHHGKRGEI
jgi:hypothetical protein